MPDANDQQDKPDAPQPEQPATGRGDGPGVEAKERHVPVFPEPELHVVALADPVLDNLGHDPRSSYVEQYWLSILGPSATLLLRRLANGLEARPDGFVLEPIQWAFELGLGAKGGKHGPLWRSIDRTCRFGAAQRNGKMLAVRRRLPPLTSRQIDRLPPQLRRSHDAWTAKQLERPRRKTISRWSDGRECPAATG